MLVCEATFSLLQENLMNIMLLTRVPVDAQWSRIILQWTLGLPLDRQILLLIFAQGPPLNGKQIFCWSLG